MEKLIQWSDELSVGIQEIDEQHKLLVKMLNELNEAIQGGRGKEVRMELFNKLVEYTRVHFAVEESLMRLLDYPHYEDHKKEHEELTGQLFKEIDRFHTMPDTSNYELLFFLKRWLTHHIMKADKAYEKFFISKGVKRSWQKHSWLERLWHH